MIRAAFEKFIAWWKATGWPGIAGAYRAHEGVRHFWTFVAGVFLGWVIR